MLGAMDQAFLLSLVIQSDRIQQALQKEGCNWHLLYEIISNVILILKEQEKTVLDYFDRLFSVSCCFSLKKNWYIRTNFINFFFIKSWISAHQTDSLWISLEGHALSSPPLELSDRYPLQDSYLTFRMYQGEQRLSCGEARSPDRQSRCLD